MEWRRATIWMTAVAALEFVLLAAAGVALLGNPLAGHFKAEAAAAAAPRLRAAHRQVPQKATLARRETSVIVLNGGGRSGAAAAAADQVRARGYLVASVGNATGTTPHTLVMYRSGFAAEGARLAHDLHVRVVSPLDGMRPAQLLGAHLVLLVG
jgi:LytR cell envelope-related transcriptional attenuator